MKIWLFSIPSWTVESCHQKLRQHPRTKILCLTLNIGSCSQRWHFPSPQQRLNGAILACAFQQCWPAIGHLHGEHRVGISGVEQLETSLGNYSIRNGQKTKQQSRAWGFIYWSQMIINRSSNYPSIVLGSLKTCQFHRNSSTLNFGI
jgi:hypothetical protein